MANVFNRTDCFTKAPNTGIPACVPRPGRLLYDIALPRGTRLTEAEAEDLFASLSAILINDTPGLRGAVVGPWVSVTSSNTDPVTESFDFGAFSTTGDGAYTFNRRITEGALCAHAALRQFNGKQDQFDWLLVFASTDPTYQYYIMGTRKLNSTTQAVELGGVKYNDIWADKWQLAEAATSAGYWFKTNMVNVRQINEGRLFVPVDFDVADLPRVSSADLSGVKALTATYDISIINSCSGLSYTDLYPALAAVGAFTVVNQLGNAVTITSVGINNGNFRILLDATDADYTAGTSFTIGLQSISTLAATPFNVEWLEGGNTVTIAK